MKEVFRPYVEENLFFKALLRDAHRRHFCNWQNDLDEPTPMAIRLVVWAIILAAILLLIYATIGGTYV